MNIKRYLSVIGALVLIVVPFAQADPDCPGSVTMNCDGEKQNVGPSYFACSTGWHAFPNGNGFNVCCKYTMQQVTCSQVQYPSTPVTTMGLDRTYMGEEELASCISTSEYQYCGADDLD